MAEPTDAVLPILRRIQAELAQMRRETGKTLENHGERLESIEGYLVYELGLTTRAKADIQPMKSDIRSMKRRLSALERSQSRPASEIDEVYARRLCLLFAGSASRRLQGADRNPIMMVV